MTNHLREIEALGQSIWQDNISRQLLDEGILSRRIEEDGISGVTSNPTIFEKAMGHSDRYDDAFRELLGETSDVEEIFNQLAYRDIRDAADLLRPTWDRTNGADGHVSFEVAASLAFDADKTIEAAQHHRAAIDRPNVLIKVPGTDPGVRAFEELTAIGLNVNVTLLFAVSRYEAIAEAYLRGLERRAERGESLESAASVASFFVSRVDTKVDAALEGTGREDLRGKAAVANAKIAYESFQRIFSGPRWEALAAKGARAQRPLWASTSTTSCFISSSTRALSRSRSPIRTCSTRSNARPQSWHTPKPDPARGAGARLRRRCRLRRLAARRDAGGNSTAPGYVVGCYRPPAVAGGVRR